MFSPSWWSVYQRRLSLTRTDITDGWRAAAQGYKRDGNHAEARRCYATARRIERTQRRRPDLRYG